MKALYALQNTLSRLNKQEPLVIGYFGGSITEGAGASDIHKTSWRALTTKWFVENFSKSRTEEVNAAIGGTSSVLGAFRCQRDLLAYGPHLVFIEFAVNDYGSAEEQILRSMEGIIRQIWTQCPETDIVFVYTTTEKHAGESYAIGKLPQSVLAHQKIADDVDSEYIRLLPLGVEMLNQPTTHPWGARSFQFKDPDGNILNFRSFPK